MEIPIRTTIPPIIFVIAALLLFGIIHAFYMYYHKRIFGDYKRVAKSYDKVATLIFSMFFSVFLFLTPLLFINNLYFWLTGLDWPESEIPRWFFTMAYILEYLAIATGLGFREFKKRLKKR